MAARHGGPGVGPPPTGEPKDQKTKPRAQRWLLGWKKEMGMRRGEEHRGAQNHKEGSKEKWTCQSGEDMIVEECCDRYSEDVRVGNGQSEGGTAPQMLLWGLE